MAESSSDRIPLRAVPDLGGLAVADAGGRPIGHLFGTLAEADTGLLRYLDLSLDGDRRHILVPIGHVRIHGGSEPSVRLRAAVLDDLRRIPTYAPDDGGLDDHYERDLLDAYGPVFFGDRYYAHPAYDHSGLYAGEHPIVRQPGEVPAAASPSGPAHLVSLGRSPDYRVARGEPDIRGWSLMTDADLPSGTVTDLIVDLEAKQVRYVLVDVVGGEGTILLPVGFLKLDARAGSVRAPGVRHDDLERLPRLSGHGVTPALEERTCAALRSQLFDRRRYELPDFGAGHLTDRRRR